MNNILESLTEKQKLAIKKLRKKIFITSFRDGFIAGLVLFLLNAIVVIVNAMFVKSDNFLLLMSVVSGILVINALIGRHSDQKLPVASEIKKILQDK